MDTIKNPPCSECGEKEQIIKNGFQGENQKYRCKMCGNNFILEIGVDTVKTPEIAPETAKSDEEIAEEMKNPKYEAFKANYKNKFDQPKESKKYGFTFSSWAEYYSERSKVIPKNKKEDVEVPVEDTEIE